MVVEGMNSSIGKRMSKISKAYLNFLEKRYQDLREKRIAWLKTQAGSTPSKFHTFRRRFQALPIPNSLCANNE